MLQLNIIVSIMKFKASDIAVDNTRRTTKINVMKRFQPESEEVSDEIVFQQQDDVNCFNFVNELVEESDHNEFNLNATEFLLQERLPKRSCKNIRSSILKSFELISNSHIIQYLVKSYPRPNAPPHFVCVRDNGFISCDNNCPKYNKEGFCGHTIGVVLKCKVVEKYASALSNCQERTVTQLASQNINLSQVGRKRPQRIRNSVKGSPEKRFQKNRSNSTEHSERFVSNQNSSNVTFSGVLLLLRPFQHRKMNCMEEHFCKKF